MIVGATTNTRLGTAGASWALAYVPIHVFWALGGSIRAFGISDPGPDWALANWSACILILGAGLLCLSLTQPWGTSLPLALRRRTAQAAGVLALVHRSVFAVTVAVTGPDAWGWWNLLVCEPWFAVMGVPSPPSWEWWLFLGAGPAVSIIGFVVLRHTSGRPDRRPRSDVRTPAPAGR